MRRTFPPQEENDFPIEPDDDGPPKLDYWDKERPRFDLVESHALALIDKTGKSALELAEEVRVRVVARAARAKSFSKAINDLVDAFLKGDFSVVVVPNAGPYKGRRSPDGDLAGLLIGMPPGWISRERVFSLWPLTHDGSSSNRTASKPSLASLYSYWITYVKRMGDSESTWQEAFNDLKAAFPSHHITVATYKALRRHEATPPHWNLPGKRSKSKRDEK